MNVHLSRETEACTRLEETTKSRSAFEEIMEDLNSPEEAMRGHALVTLSKYVRNRNQEVLKQIMDYRDIMLTILSKLADHISQMFSCYRSKSFKPNHSLSCF